MKNITLTILTLIMLAGMLNGQVTKFDKIPESVTLFQNVKVFNGIDNELQDVDVLVVKNKIHRIGKNLPTTGSWEVDIKTGGAIHLPNPMGGISEYEFVTYRDEKMEKKTVKVNIIDGGGRTLMPGLIDSHTHLNLYKNGIVPDLEATTWEELGARAAAFAQEMLAMGFTTIRDMGGAHDGLKKVIDEGILPGPRIYCAGGFVSQTSGHGDFGLPTQKKGETNMERLEIARIADGRDEVLEVCRRNFRQGAHYLKIMVSGGVTSIMDPIHGSQYSDDEIRAAVKAYRLLKGNIDIDQLLESYNTLTGNGGDE